MKYILLNRQNVVVDIIEESIRYIKLQSSNGIVVACEEKEATGVIGSDSNTHYTLIRADAQNDVNAVRVMSLEEVPSAAVVDKAVYNTETNEFEPRYTLEETQMMKQEKNKLAFAAYLASHPLTWVDGKEYGVTEQDQAEISLNLNQYQVAIQAGVENPTLEWHAKKEECQPWALEQLAALSLAISNAVYPKYHLMQKYKTAIYAATTIDEVDAIELNYDNESETE